MEIRSYQDARVYLESLIRPFASIVSPVDGSVITPLERMRVFLEKLGNPHLTFRSVVVTGSAGKGSTAYLLSQVLTEAGYRVGLTISPHLQKLNERVQINGRQISDDDLLDLLREVQKVITAMAETIYGTPSYYEALAATAFLYFSRQDLDLAVVEVGLEGTYDASNLLFPLGVILTNISLDHTELLGDTVELIATEAVCSFNHLTEEHFVVTGVKQPSVLQIVTEKSLERGAVQVSMGKDFSFVLHKAGLRGSLFDFTFGITAVRGLELALVGAYQVENASLVLAAIDFLQQFGFSVSEQVIRKSFRTSSNPGRFEILEYSSKGRTYEIVLDGAHNEAKMEAFINAMKSFYQGKQKVFIVGFKKDKRVKELLRMILPLADVLVVTEFHSSSDMTKYGGLPGEDILQIIRTFSDSNIPIFVEPDAPSALLRALKTVSSDGIIVTTGSLYLVGEMREEVVGPPSPRLRRDK